MSINEVSDKDDVMLTTSDGMIIRLQMKDVSVIGRATAGFKLIDLREGDHVAGVASVAHGNENDGGDQEKNRGNGDGAEETAT